MFSGSQLRHWVLPLFLRGDSYDEAQVYAKKRGLTENRTFIPPFDHPYVITDLGTVGMEIVKQMQGPIHAIFVPVGGACGLIAGIAAYVKRVITWGVCSFCLFFLQSIYILLQHEKYMYDPKKPHKMLILKCAYIGSDHWSRACRCKCNGLVLASWPTSHA